MKVIIVVVGLDSVLKASVLSIIDVKGRFLWLFWLEACCNWSILKILGFIISSRWIIWLIGILWWMNGSSEYV